MAAMSIYINRACVAVSVLLLLCTFHQRSKSLIFATRCIIMEAFVSHKSFQPIQYKFVGLYVVAMSIYINRACVAGSVLVLLCTLTRDLRVSAVSVLVLLCTSHQRSKSLIFLPLDV